MVFTEDGAIGSLTQRGTSTIQVLGLNRAPLVEARARSIEQSRLEFMSLVSADSTRDKAVRRLLNERREYAGAIRQCLAALIKELGLAPSSSPVIPKLSKRRRQEAIKFFQHEQAATDSYSIADEQDRSRFLSRSRAIERIEIRNFRAIEHLTLSFSENEVTGGSDNSDRSETRAGWLMLLGENAVGKTSIMQAVALALVGEKWRSDVITRNRIDASDCMRRGAKSGYVKIHL